MQRYWIADLQAPPTHIWAEDGPLLGHHQEWVQSNELWSMAVYDHDGVVHVNSRTVLYRRGDLLVYPPGCKVGHPRTGPELKLNRVSFPLPGRGSRMAIPVRSTLPFEFQHMFTRAETSSGHKVGYITAVVWALLWHFAEPESVYRTRSALYECEDFIRKNLSRSLSVHEVAAVANVPERTIQRLFRQEHGVGLATFIREVRVREAVRMLVDTDEPIKKVANTVGISSSQRFYQLMKDSMGASPTEIRAHQGPLATATWNRPRLGS